MDMKDAYKYLKSMNYNLQVFIYGLRKPFKRNYPLKFIKLAMRKSSNLNIHQKIFKNQINLRHLQIELPLKRPIEGLLK
jgi:hypothetical protein